jgi:hypothetical protein
MSVVKIAEAEKEFKKFTDLMQPDVKPTDEQEDEAMTGFTIAAGAAVFGIWRELRNIADAIENDRRRR